MGLSKAEIARIKANEFKASVLGHNNIDSILLDTNTILSIIDTLSMAGHNSFTLYSLNDEVIAKLKEEDFNLSYESEWLSSMITISW